MRWPSITLFPRERWSHTVTRFLWFPKRLRRHSDYHKEWRWLETATWSRIRRTGNGNGCYDGYWDGVLK